MKERGVIFTRENRQKSRNGDKTMTRRVIIPINKDPDNYKGPFFNKVTGLWEFLYLPEDTVLEIKCPYAAGDHLYLQEPYRITASLCLTIINRGQFRGYILTMSKDLTWH